MGMGGQPEWMSGPLEDLSSEGLESKGAFFRLSSPVKCPEALREDLLRQPRLLGILPLGRQEGLQDPQDLPSPPVRRSTRLSRQRATS